MISLGRDAWEPDIFTELIDETTLVFFKVGENWLHGVVVGGVRASNQYVARLLFVILRLLLGFQQVVKKIIDRLLLVAGRLVGGRVCVSASTVGIGWAAQ